MMVVMERYTSSANILGVVSHQNVVDLTEVIRQLRKEGYTVNPEDLSTLFVRSGGRSSIRTRRTDG
ncbi:hypothetical protein SAMN05444392_101350 [Seinonella peptonophila]|uniref:Uncharacterized protein n=1 Tax=Seinonella peptonophila TaxID=112248 RepID=A0A1M4T7P4_9BACL|nr:hypothetical protein SAMN05444392_101350 [Seinonella peptonophila]